jgi:hypothetical protein
MWVGVADGQRNALFVGGGADNDELAGLPGGSDARSADHHAVQAGGKGLVAEYFEHGHTILSREGASLGKRSKVLKGQSFPSYRERRVCQLSRPHRGQHCGPLRH